MQSLSEAKSFANSDTQADKPVKIHDKSEYSKLICQKILTNTISQISDNSYANLIKELISDHKKGRTSLQNQFKQKIDNLEATHKN